MSPKTSLIPALLVIFVLSVAGVGGTFLLSKTDRGPVAAAPLQIVAAPLPASLDGELVDAVHQLSQVTGRLSRRLDDITVQVNKLESRSAAPPRIAVETPKVEQTSEATEFLAALSDETSVPPGFDAWFAQASDEKEAKEREERRVARKETIDEMMDSRMETLTDTLNLAPYQADEVRNILANQMSAVSAIWSESSNRLESFRAMGPLREKVNTEMAAILTPEQFTTYAESSTNGPPFGPMRGAGRE